MKKIKMTLSGKVQGVGFRYFTKLLADKLAITGLVRNLANGEVYLEACGKETALEEFIQLVKNSPAPRGKVVSYSLIYDDTLPDYKKFKMQ